MCTVVCRWDPDDAHPVQMLALRDERRSREFDLPGTWWPDAPAVVGGRDRKAGGSWCVSDVETGCTAVVLNRPERMRAAPGAATRGVLPLLAAKWTTGWSEHVDLDGMASFNLVLAEARALSWWSFDGEHLEHHSLGAGSYVFKPRGRVGALDDSRLLDGRGKLTDAAVPTVPTVPTATAWGRWFDALTDSTPGADGEGLLVKRPLEDGDSYETVIAQFVAAAPGALRLDYRVAPTEPGPWTTRTLP